MADDRTNTGTGPRTGNGLESVKDGTSNTVVLDEKQGGASAQAAATNEIVVIAERDSTTGETTLVEGKSTGGEGPVQISGTNIRFEDKAEFDQFLADVNAKEDAGVPFEDIIGNAVNAIPIVEDGVATGETLGGIVTGPLQDGVVPVAGRPREEVAKPGPDEDEATPNNLPPSPTGGFQDGGRRGPAADRGDQPVNFAPGSAQPGRDQNGNLLPGAEGRVTLDDFNRINDRDGNGINDGVENPVDLGGNGSGLQSGTNGEARDGGARHDDEGHSGRQPGRDADGNLLPGAEGRVTLDDFVRINGRDGNGILDSVENPVGLRGDRPGFEPPAVRPGLQIPDDLHLPEPGPTFEPGGDGTPDIPGRGPTVVIDPVFPVAPQPPAGQHDDHGNHGAVVTEPPPPAATVPPAQNGATAPADAPALDSAAPAGPIDTFETGIAPAAALEAAVAPAPSEESSAPVAAPTADTSVPPAVETESPAAPDASAPDYIGGVDVVGAAAGLAPFGPGNSATDVFDAETIRAAASTAVAGTTEEGGANLLERIFDKVKDILFESGPSSPSPVQLPQATAQAPEELVSASVVDTADSVVSFEVDEAPSTDDDLDDGLQ